MPAGSGTECDRGVTVKRVLPWRATKGKWHYHGSKRDGHLIRLGSQVAGFFLCEDASVNFLAVYNGTSPLCLWVQFPNCRKIPGASVVLVLSFGSLVLVLSFGSL